MSKKTVAELLVETLAVAGVERICGVAGDSLNGITDAIRRHEQLRWLPVRHEEAAVQDGFISVEEFDRLVDLQEMVGNPHRDHRDLNQTTEHSYTLWCNPSGVSF